MLPQPGGTNGGARYFVEDAVGGEVAVVEASGYFDEQQNLADAGGGQRHTVVNTEQRTAAVDVHGTGGNVHAAV